MASLNIAQSPLQIHTASSFAGMTEQNHLFNSYAAQSDMIGSALAYGFSNSAISGGNQSTLNLLTGGLGNSIEVESPEYTWDLYGANARAIDVIEVMEVGNTTPGIGVTPFRVKLSEKWFSATDNLRADDGTFVRIQSEPYQDGGGYVYTMVLTDGDPTKFIDTSMIAVGARFSKSFSTVEEFSERGGGTSFSTPFKMKNCLTTLRKQHAVTRSAAKTRLIVDFFDPADSTRKKKTRTWVTQAEWTFMAEWFKEKDRAAIYSTYNKNGSNGYNLIPGENGRPVYTGAGLRQQISPLNVRTYNQLTYDLLDNLFLDLSFNANKVGGNHNFLLLTGKMGMRAFSDAISAKFKSLGVNIISSENSNRFITGSGNELEFTGDQWTKVNLPNGVSLTVREFAPYDDIIENRQLHPLSKKPVESYRMSIFNFGSAADGKANIKQVSRKDSKDVMWSINGSIDSSGTTASGFSTGRASSKDGYEIHALSEEGIVMMDPTSSAELVFALD